MAGRILARGGVESITDGEAPTTTGTAANAALLDGLGASAFMKSGIGGQSSPGFVRLDCGGGGATQDVQLAGFGTLHFFCLPHGLGPGVELVGDSPFVGFMTTSKSETTSWVPADDAQQLLSMALAGVPEGFFVQARQVAGNATTVTVQGSVVQEITRHPGPYDILYSATEQ